MGSFMIKTIAIGTLFAFISGLAFASENVDEIIKKYEGSRSTASSGEKSSSKEPGSKSKSKKKKKHQEESPAAVEAAAPAQAGEQEHSGEAQAKEADKESDKESHTNHRAPSEHAKGLSADKAFELLQEGNFRYASGDFKAANKKAADRERLASGQAPHSIIVSCSDSRVPPEVIFDQGLGDLFVVRNAGETVDQVALGSIEYAVEHLGTNLIFVLGHESCGAVKAAHSTFGNKDAGSPALNKLVNLIQPNIKNFEGKSASQGYISEGTAQAKAVAASLQGSKIISERLSAGTLKIKVGMYLLHSGAVVTLN